jgi:hypothetical protein
VVVVQVLTSLLVVVVQVAIELQVIFLCQHRLL